MVKFRNAKLVDANQIAHIHIESSLNQPGGFMHQLGYLFILNYYKLFCYNNTTNNKTIKNQRIGLIHACAVAIIYSYKRDIASSWTSNEIIIITKIKDISMNLFSQIKKEIVIDDDKPIIEKEKVKPKIDGLTYLYDYIPKMSSIINTDNNEIFEDEYKTIIK